MLVKFSRGGLFLLFAIAVIHLLGGLAYLSNSSLPPRPEAIPPQRQTINNIDVKVRKVEGGQVPKGSRKSKMMWCQPLRFLLGLNRPTTALASFPGSGNTWLRYLLQQATGINTGSVYKDYGLLKNGFPGECIANSSVSVVKTHERGPLAFQGYHKAVLLVRDPTQAILAEFNRQGGGHIGFAPPHRYKLRKGKYWAKFVDDQIIKWKKTNLDWLFNFTGPMFIVFYDDLVNNLEANLRSIVSFIELHISEDNLKCALERREGIYRRKKRLVNLDPFTEKMKSKMKDTKQEVYSLLYDYVQNRKVESR